MRLAGDDCRAVTDVIETLRYYLGQRRCALPEGIVAERAAWLVCGCDALLRMLFAQQPPEMPFTAYARERLSDLRFLAGAAAPPDARTAAWLTGRLRHHAALDAFLRRQEADEVGGMVQALAENIYRRRHRRRVLASGTLPEQRQAPGFIDDVRRGRVRVNDFDELWQLALLPPERLRAADDLRNALLEGGYFFLAERQAIGELLLDPRTYAGLRDAARARVVDALANCLGMFDAAQRDRAYAIAAQLPAAQREQVLAAGRALAERGGHNLLRLTAANEARSIRERLEQHIDAMPEAMGGTLRYVAYDDGDIEAEDFAGMDTLLDATVEGVQRQYRDGAAADADLWDNRWFQFAWLCGTAWFSFAWRHPE